MPALDSQSLYDSAKCFTCLGVSEAEALELALLVAIVQNGVAPVEAEFRITEAGDFRITESGDSRIIE